MRKQGEFFLMATLFAMSTHCVAVVTQADRDARKAIVQSIKDRVAVNTLDNGLTVLSFYAPNTNKVSVGGLVDAGNRHEKSSEWGIAHILEHMFFKGSKNFPEGTLDKLTTNFGMRIGRDFNAATWSDHTFYSFDSDAANWQIFGDVIADRFQHLEINPSALSSELGAILQELKLRERDQDLLRYGIFFPQNHPYNHRSIGYKEEIIAFTPEQIVSFYERFYTPDRMTFFVCGNVNPADVLAYAQKAFGEFNRKATEPFVEVETLPFYAGFSSTEKKVYHSQLNRKYQYAWIGAKIGTVEAAGLSAISYALKRRLTQKWVDSNGWCLSVNFEQYALECIGYFAIAIEPKEEFYGLDYDTMLAAELADIMANGLTDEEFTGMYHDGMRDLATFAENPSELLNRLSMTSMLHADVFTYFCREEELAQNITQDDIQQAAAAYLRPILMSTEKRMPLPAEERGAWQALQQGLLAHEKALVASRLRTDGILPFDASVLPMPTALPEKPMLGFESFVLSNGMTVYWRQEPVSPRAVFSLVVHNNEQVGLMLGAAHKGFAKSNWNGLLLHGTDRYSKKEFEDLCDCSGVSIESSSSSLTVTALDYNFEKGLELLRLALDKPQLPIDILERKKADALEVIVQQQNNLSYQLAQYLTKTLYHDWTWKFLEAEEKQHIAATTMDDISGMISVLRDPSKVVGIMTGNMGREAACALAETYFGSLSAQSAVQTQSVEIPKVADTASGHVEVANERSWVFCARILDTGLSLDDAVCAVLNDYLAASVWKIRESTGLFYGGQGRVSRGTLLLPGAVEIIILATATTTERLLAEVRTLVTTIYENGLDDATVQSLKASRLHARGTYIFTPQAVVAEAATAVAQGLPLDFERDFDEQVAAVTTEQVNAVIKKLFDPATWSFISVGRSSAA
ncbi:MAG: zinc protease [Candidatus Dependentiae bacterium]|nr:zinc protease [Candidatus Dependentiae bacterium]